MNRKDADTARRLGAPADPEAFRQALAEALNRAGHVVVTRASQAAVDTHSPGGDAGAARDGHGAAAEISALCPCEDPAMRGHLHSVGAHQVSTGVLLAALKAAADYPVESLDDCPEDHISFMREGLAAASPAIRAQVADEIRAARPWDPYDSRHDGMEHAEHIARGDA